MQRLLRISILSLALFSLCVQSFAAQAPDLDRLEKTEIEQELLEAANAPTVQHEASVHCLDQYRHRRNVLLGHALGSPLAFPLETAGIMFVAALIDKALNPGAFFPGLAGAGMGFFIGAGIFVTYETVVIVKLARIVSMINLLKALQANNTDKLQQFYKRARRTLHQTPEQLPDAVILAKLRAFDQRQAFCNAELVSARRQKRYAKRQKIKDALAFKTDVIKALLAR